MGREREGGRALGAARAATLLFGLVPALAGCDGPSAPPPPPMLDAGPERPDAPRIDAGPTDAGPVRADPILPTAAGTCPDFSAAGTVTVSPAGTGPRQVRVIASDAATALDGPLVFYWHGAGGSPAEAEYALGTAALAAVLDAGGIVVAPVHDPAAGSLPWFLSIGSREDDLFVADEVVACAEATAGIDEHRIHAIGFSAGALHTTQMSFRRASYLASVVTYSGGLLNPRTPPPLDAPDARFAAMMLHGGPDDVVVVAFEETTANYLTVVRRNGHFGFVCAHGLGHTVPPAARDGAWAFLDAHRYGVQPPPYASGLPPGFYAPCALAP